MPPFSSAPTPGKDLPYVFPNPVTKFVTQLRLQRVVRKLRRLLFRQLRRLVLRQLRRLVVEQLVGQLRWFFVGQQLRQLRQWQLRWLLFQLRWLFLELRRLLGLWQWLRLLEVVVLFQLRLHERFVRQLLVVVCLRRPVHHVRGHVLCSCDLDEHQLRLQLHQPLVRLWLQQLGQLRLQRLRAA